MADKLESDIRRMKKEIEQLISRKLPVVAGKYAKQQFQDNFRQGGFVNGGLHSWTPSKRLSSLFLYLSKVTNFKQITT